MARSFGIRSLVNSGSGVTNSVSGSTFFGEQALSSAVPSWGRQSFENVGFEDGKLLSRRHTGAQAYAKDATDLDHFRDHFSTLGISRGASKREIKSAYRKLAQKYHPDVCHGESCTRNFLQISRAYERAMLGLPPLSDEEDESPDEYVEGCMGVDDDSWDDWEEWMGWEGAGTRDYTTHINPNLSI